MIADESLPTSPPTRRELLFWIGGAAVGMLAPRHAVTRSLEFNSPYNFVYIEKKGSSITFRYSLNGGRMSALDLSNPAYQMVPYTRYFYAADLIRKNPSKVLMAGLGAGGFNRLFNLVYPEAQLVTVEIDPMIVSLAEEHAGFRTGPSNQVVLDDARIFLRRSREIYDWILLDAFDRNSQVPVHLTTREFYETLRDRLADDGVMLVNLHQGTRFFASHILTIRAVFSDVVLLPVKDTGNIIAMAIKSATMPSSSYLMAFDSDNYTFYLSYGVDLTEIARSVVTERDYLPKLESRGMVLTDDFAPVESLDQKVIPTIRPRQPEH